MKRLTAFFVFLGIILGFCTDSYADRRGYVWTYEYMTMPKGMKEIEYYFTTEFPDASESNINTMKHWVEFEYGISNHWDIALYQQLKAKNNDPDFEYDGFKVRARYRIAEKNKLPVDVLLYFEYKRDGDFHKPNKWENKIILAKDIGKFNLSYNAIFEHELESDGRTEFEYAAGFNYQLNQRAKIGIETKGSYTSDKYYLGPTISWTADSFWFSAGVGAGLDKRADDLQVRFIVGKPF